MGSDEKLVAIKAALFPEPENTYENFSVSYDVADNIESAIYDLKRTGADSVCIATLEKIEQQLLVAKRFIEAT